jgi:hypothetical protein
MFLFAVLEQIHHETRNDGYRSTLVVKVAINAWMS